MRVSFHSFLFIWLECSNGIDGFGWSRLSNIIGESIYSQMSRKKQGFDDFGSSGRACLVEKSWIIHTKRHLPHALMFVQKRGWGVLDLYYL